MNRINSLLGEFANSIQLSEASPSALRIARIRSIRNPPGFIRHESLKPFLENSLGIRWELVQLFFEGFFKTGEQSVS
jgi:hypothetical protein